MVAGSALGFRGKAQKILAAVCPVEGQCGGHVHLCPLTQALDEEPVVLLGLKGGLLGAVLKQGGVGPVGAGGDGVNNVHSVMPFGGFSWGRLPEAAAPR